MVATFISAHWQHGFPTVNMSNSFWSCERNTRTWGLLAKTWDIAVTCKKRWLYLKRALKAACSRTRCLVGERWRLFLGKLVDRCWTFFFFFYNIGHKEKHQECIRQRYVPQRGPVGPNSAAFHRQATIKPPWGVFISILITDFHAAQPPQQGQTWPWSASVCYCKLLPLFTKTQ